MTRRDWIVVMVPILFFGLLCRIVVNTAWAHDHYGHWRIPGTNASCCNEKKLENGVVTGDCYPTAAEVRAGSWWARRDNGEWVQVPDNRILREVNPDETGQDAHLCYSDMMQAVLCFVPPTGGS